jgi:hypothetical protein
MTRCRCNGANEFCAFCFGTGVVGPRTPQSGNSKQKPALPPQSAVNDTHSRPALVTCPQCGTRVPFNEVGAHAKSAHPSSSVRGRKSSQVSVNRRPLQPDTKGSERARNKQRDEYVFKHLPARWDKFGPNYTLTCRRCGGEMNQALLPGHLRQVHGVRDPFEMIRVGGRFSNGPHLGRRQPEKGQR